jgi:hypothetical protein
VTAAGQVTFATAENATRTTQLADLVTWGALVEPKRGIQVLMAGGGLILADALALENESLEIESDLLEVRHVPLEAVAAILFHLPRDLQERDRLASRARAESAQGDRLLLANGDELTGHLVAIGDAAIDFESQGQKIKVETARVAAIGFDPSLVARQKTPGLRTLVGLSDGSRLVVGKIAIERDEAELTLVEGAAWTVPVSALVYLQPLTGKARYLSDMTADSYRHLPFLSQAWLYRNDANVAGTQLRAQGHPYAKGLGLHSAARLTYRLDQHYRAFEADVALDDQVASGGSVICAVYVDDKLAWKGDVIRGGAAPVPVKVDVSGAKRLSLIVEYAERGDELDRVDWLNARLVE